MAKTEAQLNRYKRQESLRELLAKQGHLQHVCELLDKLAKLDKELNATEVNRLRIVVDTKLRLISKYLPDLKNIDIEGDVDSTITIIRKAYADTDAE